MKRIALAIATVFTVAAPAAFAQYDRYDGYRDNRDTNYYPRERDIRRGDSARVIESRPLYASEHARQECWNARAGHYEEIREQGDSRIGKGAAIGAIAGGVLGHQVDHGTGTAAGAVIGGLLGHQVEKRNDRDDQPDLDRSRCRVIADSGAPVQGYDVRYEYEGREYVTRMDRDPGRRLRVGRDVREDGTPFDELAAR
jgi:uncharacterized protein YcfJ